MAPPPSPNPIGISFHPSGGGETPSASSFISSSSLFPWLWEMLPFGPRSPRPAATGGYLGDLAVVSRIPGLSRAFRAALKRFARALRPFHRQFTVNSALRDAETNARVGGVENSLHLSGNAVDLFLPAAFVGNDGATALLDRAARRARLRVILYPRHLHVERGVPLGVQQRFAGGQALLGGFSEAGLVGWDNLLPASENPFWLATHHPAAFLPFDL